MPAKILIGRGSSSDKSLARCNPRNQQLASWNCSWPLVWASPTHILQGLPGWGMILQSCKSFAKNTTMGPTRASWSNRRTFIICRRNISPCSCAHIAARRRAFPLPIYQYGTVIALFSLLAPVELGLMVIFREHCRCHQKAMLLMVRLGADKHTNRCRRLPHPLGSRLIKNGTEIR